MNDKERTTVVVIASSLQQSEKEFDCSLMYNGDPDIQAVVAAAGKFSVNHITLLCSTTFYPETSHLSTTVL